MSNTLYSAIKISLTGRVLTYIVQFACLAIYARIFTPEQFGIIASIQVFVIFFQMLSDVGIGPAIINEEKFSPRQRDGIFSFTLVFGFCLAVVFYFFSYFLNSLYIEYSYQQIALLVSFSIVFHSLAIVPVASLNKDAQFIKKAKADSISELFSLAFVYILFLLHFGVLALAARTLVQSLVRFIIVFYQSNDTSMGRAGFNREIHHIKKLARFAGYQFSFNFINYFSRNLDNILIAKYLGASSLGLYEKAYQLMRYPLMLTTFAMTPAIQPILTKVRDDVEKVVEEHNRLAKRLLFISLLMSAFLFINSENIVFFIFGSQWVSIVPFIEIFSFMIPIQAILSTSGSFFQVMNQPKLLFFSGLISAILNVLAIVIGVAFLDMELIAKSLVVSFAFNFAQTYYLLFKCCFRHSLLDFYKQLVNPLLFAFALIIIYLIIKFNVLNHFIISPMFDLFLNVFISILVVMSSIKPMRKILL